MTEEQLKELLADDDLGLLEVKAAPSPVMNEHDRLIESFEQIQRFVDEEFSIPNEKSESREERRLAQHLKSIKFNQQDYDVLKHVDRHGILEEPKITSIDDILGHDEMGILDDDAESILDVTSLPVLRKDTEYVAKKKTCENFQTFEPLFKQCQRDLKEGKRKILPFAKMGSIKQGDYYLLGGVLLYVAECEADKMRKLGDRLRPDSRLRVVYENGSESDLLRRSLGKALISDGKRISAHEDRVLQDEVHHTDSATGFIYVLKSLTTDPQILEVSDLHKIGYSRQTTEERIKNAENEPTYLMAPVEVVSEYECYNMNPQKLEHILHTVFGGACLKLDIFDHEGQRHSPREWFSVPFQVIEETLTLIITGEISNYRYDINDRKLVTH